MNIVDMHCDTISRLLSLKDKGKQEGLLENSGHLDLHRMHQNGYLLQNFALFVNLRQCVDPWEEVCRLAKLYEEEIQKNADYLSPVLQYEDIERNREAGKISALLTVEEGGVCQGRRERLQTLYEMGVRMMTLTWNYSNELGTPEGLLPIGVGFVEQMENLGMIVDVSHLSDKGFYDLVTVARKPFVASHSNVRAICGHKRNLTDHMIRMIGERGGCVGLNLYPPFLLQKKGASSDLQEYDREQQGYHREQQGYHREQQEYVKELIEAAVAHAKHIVKVGGEGVLGLGSDFDGFEEGREYWGISCLQSIVEELKKAGFSARQVDGFLGENVLQFYKENL